MEHFMIHSLIPSFSGKKVEIITSLEALKVYSLILASSFYVINK